MPLKLACMSSVSSFISWIPGAYKHSLVFLFCSKKKTEFIETIFWQKMIDLNQKEEELEARNPE